MGAHSAAGHHPGRTATVTAGVAAALVTTATTGVLTGGTALASDGHGGSGHHHHSEDSRSSQGDPDQDSDSSGGFAQQTLCDVLGDVDLGGNGSCSSDDSDSSGHADSDDADDSDDSGDDSSGFFGSSFPGQGGEQSSSSGAHAAPAPQPAPKPAPKPASSVPNDTTVQPIARAARRPGPRREAGRPDHQRRVRASLRVTRHRRPRGAPTSATTWRSSPTRDPDAGHPR